MYLRGFRSPDTPATERGSRIHALLEAYYRSKVHTIPEGEDGEILVKALEHLPPWGTPGLIPEREVQPILTPGGNMWVARIDVHVPGDVVADLKTCSSFAYMPTVDQLARDSQAVLYAYATGERRVRWVYTRTKGAREARKVEHVFSEDELRERVKELDQRARKRYLLRASDTDPLTLPPTPSACEKFNGCSHQSRCNLTLEERYPNMSQPFDMSSLFGPIAQPIAPIAPPAPVAPPPCMGKFLTAPGTGDDGPIVRAPNGMPLPPQMVQTQTVPDPTKMGPAFAGQAPAMIPIRPVGPPMGEHLNALAEAWAKYTLGNAAPVAINPPEQSLAPAAPTGLPPAAAVSPTQQPPDITSLLGPAAPAPEAKKGRASKKDAAPAGAGDVHPVGQGIVTIVLNVTDPAMAQAIATIIAKAVAG